MSVTGVLTRLALRTAAAVVALASWLVIWNCWQQMDRDRACSAGLRAAVVQIEKTRAQLGHQPSESELEGMGASSVTLYARLRDRPEKLLSLGALADDDYMFAQWRGEQFDYYYSWSGEDTCDSGAWKLLLGLGVPLAGLSALLLWVSLPRQRSARVARAAITP